MNSSDLVYNPVTDNCQEFVSNLLTAAASDDTNSRYEFELDDMFVHSVRQIVYIGYATYFILHSIALYGEILMALWAMYGFQYAVEIFDATNETVPSMINTFWSVSVQFNIFYSPSWLSYGTFIVFTTGSVQRSTIL